MPTSACRVRQPRPGPDWIVRQVAERRDWSDEIGACAFCGVPVDMRGSHYDMELVRVLPDNPNSKRSFEYERFVFCDYDCVDGWHRAE